MSPQRRREVEPIDASHDMLADRMVGHYAITGMVGAGGMGAVYRARDTRLGREVAIKVLPAEWLADPDRRARFEREARVLAALNHPNIATIHGIEDAAGTPAIVMELVEGDTLADRIARASRGLPVAEALAIARQIAEALDAAHEKGIVHRDLKPSNIAITPDGRVKVLDFGLAKLVADDSSAPDLTQSPTVTVAGTRDGVLLGTAAYMSPEQARGLPVDKRTDIWAFGCVLYEMLTGRAAFLGETVSDTIARILEREPDWTALPPTTPPEVVHTIARCLEKDVKRRQRDIGDVVLDPAPAHERAAPALHGSRRWWWLAAAATATMAGIAAVIGAGDRLVGVNRPQTAAALNVSTRLTADEGFSADPAISRDGALVAYASDRAGDNQLDIWVQQTTGGAPIRVTHDPIDEREPSFSPDGTHIAFRSEREGGGIYVVPTFGQEAPRFVAARGRRPRFSPDGKWIAYWTGGNIGFTNAPGSYRTFVVPVAGGTPREVAPMMTGARFPVWAPDSKSLLVAASRAGTPDVGSYDWWVVPLEHGEPIDTGAFAQIHAAGVDAGEGTAGLNSAITSIGPDDWSGSRVLFSNFDFLYALTLDERTHRAASVERLTFGTNHDAQAATGGGDRVVFSSASFVNTVWGLPLDVNRGVATGEPHRLTAGVAFDARPSASADARRITYRSTGLRTTALVKDLQTNRIVDLGVRPSNFGPAMSPDGRWVAFETIAAASDQAPSGGGGIDVVASEGGPSRTLCRDCNIGDWTADSRSLAVVRRDGLTLIDVATGNTRDVVVARSVNRPFPHPGGHLIAFRQSRAADSLLYVAPMNQPGTVPATEWIPIGAGENDIRPCGWSPDGRLLYFVSSRDGTRCLYAIRIDPATGRPQGDAFAVRHFHGTRNAWAGTTGVLSTGPGNAIRGGQFLYDIATFSANVWLMSPSLRVDATR